MTDEHLGNTSHPSFTQDWHLKGYPNAKYKQHVNVQTAKIQAKKPRDTVQPEHLLNAMQVKATTHQCDHWSVCRQNISVH